MSQADVILVSGLELDNQSMRSLERLLRKMVKVMCVYSGDAPSRRIEGQFGSEVMEEQFSDMVVYLQYSSITAKPEAYESIIRGIYKGCCNVNRHYQMLNRVYLFNRSDEQIQLACRNQVPGQAFNAEKLSQAIKEFQPSENVQTLAHLNRIEENTLMVFITDSEGCELSEALMKRYRRANKQAIWVKAGEDSMEIQMGFPETNSEQDQIS
jgi:hypothetical protein